MTIDELKDSINLVINEVNSIQLYFILKQNEKFIIKLADIEDGSASDDLKDMFIKDINKDILENIDLQLCCLATDDEKPNAIYYYDYDTYPEEFEILKNFNITIATDSISKFDFTQDNLSELFGYIIFIGNMNNGIVLFKMHHQISLFQRSKFLIKLTKDKKRFERMSGEDILKLTGKIDALKLNGNIYVKNLKILENSKTWNKLIQKKANHTIEELYKLNILENIEYLKKSIIDEPSFARKLSKIQKTSPIFRLNIPKQEIIDFTKVTPKLKDKFKYNEDGTSIILDTKKSRQEFLKLINDEYLHSELTKQYYEASAKNHLE